MSALPDWLLSVLVCPVCGVPLGFEGRGEDGVLSHPPGDCREEYPVIEGIPRLLVGPERRRLVATKRTWFTQEPRREGLARRWAAGEVPDASDVVAGFDFEWARFAAVGTADLRAISERYFVQVPPELFGSSKIALDAGCGAGRWAYEVARRGARVIALDLGISVELARRNTSGAANVACVQADVRRLPIRAGSLDWAYSLGVLHHIEDPRPAVAELCRVVRPRGLVLLYLYYALDGRGPAYRAVFRAVDLLRRAVSRAPRPCVLVVASATALLVYFPLARLSALVERLGLHGASAALPLSFYRDLPLRVMLNDSLDRFGTRIENRYRRGEIVDLMRGAGLSDVAISDAPPYWHGIGVVRESARMPS